MKKSAFKDSATTTEQFRELNQRQFLTLYRLSQFGFATRKHLTTTCFRDTADPDYEYSRRIVPITRGQGRKKDEGIVLSHDDLLYLGKAAHNLLLQERRETTRQAFATSNAEADEKPRYFRGLDSAGQPTPYNVKALKDPPRIGQDPRLDEYYGIADVLAKFVLCEGGIVTTRDNRYTIDRVEVYAKPDDVKFKLDGKAAELKPDGLVIIYRADKNGKLGFDWFYVEYEDTSDPLKKVESLRRYAQFYWKGGFKENFNGTYRHRYDLVEVGEAGRPVDNPRFKVLVVCEDTDGSGYLDLILQSFRFLEDTGLDHRKLGFPSPVMGMGQFLFCQRSALNAAEHALEPIWLNGAEYQRRQEGKAFKRVTCL